MNLHETTRKEAYSLLKLKKQETITEFKKKITDLLLETVQEDENNQDEYLQAMKFLIDVVNGLQNDIKGINAHLDYLVNKEEIEVK